MFKELKILKLSLFAIFLMVIIWNVSESYKFSMFYAKSASTNIKEKIKVFQIANYSSNSEFFSLKKINGKLVYQEEFKSLNNLSTYSNKELLPENNLIDFHLPDSCRSGIYTMNDNSFVLTSAEEAEITIVYPYVNNQIFQEVNNSTVVLGKTCDFSIKHPVLLDKYTKGMARYFEYCEKHYSVNYISDLDLESPQMYSGSRLLIIYGQSSFYTDKMKTGIVDFVKNGGNILLMSSSFCSNVIWHKKGQISFKEDSTQSECNITSWLKLKKELRRDFGLSHRYGGEALSIIGQSYSIIVDHPLFENVKKNSIPIEADLFLGEYCDFNQDSTPYAKKLFFYSNELLAYNLCKFGKKTRNVGGIYITQPKSTSGSIVSLGTEDWCLEKNMRKSEIWQISINAVSFLLK